MISALPFYRNNRKEYLLHYLRLWRCNFRISDIFSGEYFSVSLNGGLQYTSGIFVIQLIGMCFNSLSFGVVKKVFRFGDNVSLPYRIHFYM